MEIQVTADFALHVIRQKTKKGTGILCVPPKRGGEVEVLELPAIEVEIKCCVRTDLTKIDGARCGDAFGLDANGKPSSGERKAAEIIGNGQVLQVEPDIVIWLEGRRFSQRHRHLGLCF